MFGSALLGLKKESAGKTERTLCKMSSKEQMALKEARKIVRLYGSKIEHPFKYGQGSLDQ